MLINKTPLRVTILGGGTDFPNYYLKNECLVINVAISYFIYLQLNRLTLNSGYILRYSKNEKVSSTNKINHPIIKHIFTKYNIKDVELTITSEIPSGTGLGSSSSFIVGLLNLIHGFIGHSLSKKSIYNEAYEIEKKFLGQNIGFQDFIPAIYGNTNVTVASSKLFKVHKYKHSDLLSKILETNSILIPVGQSRSAHDILKKHGYLVNEHYLDKIKNLAYSFYNSGPPNIYSLAESINEAHKLKINYNPLTSEPYLESMIGNLNKLGALGNKIIGAGKSGFLLSIYENSEFINRLEDAGIKFLPLKICNLGSTNFEL